MIVPVRDLLKIENLDNYNLMFNRKDPSFSAAFIVSQKRDIEKSYVITKKHLDNLLNKGIIRVSINTNREIIEVLKKINPDLFIPPTGSIKVSKLPQMVKEYEIMNQSSKKKRKITLLNDIYSAETDRVSGEKPLLIEYSTILTSKVISSVKDRFDPEQDVFYKDSENGVLVFVPDVKRFKLKVDLFAILASLELDIFDSKTVAEAINIYKNEHPKLVVLGNLNGNLDAKVVLLEIEEYDPYVKKSNYDESPASNREFETQRIKSNYFSGYSKFLELENREKDALPEEIKQNITEAIYSLQKKYTFKNYIETSFAVKQFGRMFNVTALQHMLLNIKNSYSNR